MIPRSQASVQSTDGDSDHWQARLRQSTMTAAQLLARLQIEPPPALAARGQDQFPLRVPPAFLARIRRGDPHDPLLRQVLPLAAEDSEVAGFSHDPVGDGAAQKQPGLLHKYHGRVLLTLTGACAIHCRYCFRRHFPYAEANPARGAWQQTLDYLRADSSITEVILSGGDPLALTDARLAAMAADLGAIKHLKRLRIHSRLPVVLPERITEELLDWLTASRLKPVLVIHSNHANEIGPEAAAALQRLHRRGIHLLNQAVLLAGVNNNARALIDLSETLFENNVLPYYLHMLDAVAGAAHFNVSDAAAGELLEQLRTRLPGYLVPRLVREASGEPYKTPLL